MSLIVVRTHSFLFVLVLLLFASVFHSVDSQVFNPNGRYGRRDSASALSDASENKESSLGMKVYREISQDAQMENAEDRQFENQEYQS
uniref:U-scoloptoxin(23)-Er1a n=1 Tax=Ethmostigmus rubripes TaxID=62613 RepID=TXN1A_ETHRU|nr:RecName: Full=U-scoloptoxin(23)-Er1a; Short=U-SLPTX(23)-Er1a; Flags: Precursor [Ethmostigmus rubripes]